MKKVTYKYINRHNNLVEETFEFTSQDYCRYLVVFYNAQTHRDIVIDSSQIISVEDID